MSMPGDVWRKLELAMRRIWLMHKVVAFIAASLLFVLGVLAVLMLGLQPFLPQFLVGTLFAAFVAILVALIVGATVERASREELGIISGRLRDDVLSEVLRKIVPPAVFEQIRNHVLLCPFVRDDLLVVCDLRRMETEARQCARLALTLKYKLSCLTENRKLYKVGFMLGPSPDPFLRRHRAIERVVITLNGEEEVIEKEALERWTREDTHMMVFEKEIEISQSDDVEVEASGWCAHNVDDTLNWVSFHPSLGMEVICRFSEDFAVEVVSLHPGPLESELERPGLKRYRQTRALLPYQGFSMLWHLKRKEEVDLAERW